jgi:hypothetical protein
MRESFLLQLSLECPACRISLPVNGIVGSVRCYHCAETTTLGADFWTRALPLEHFVEAQSFESGYATEVSDDELRLTYGRRLPRCQQCKGPDVDLNILAKEAIDGTCHCTGCGKPIRVREADALCRTVHPRARYVVNESALDAAAQSLQAQTKPVLFQCMGCGAGLSVDGSSRAVTCRYCQNSNYLPDGLWQSFRPVPKPEVFFLICEFENAEERKVSAARTDLPSDYLASFSDDPDVEVRTTLAGNPSLATETMAKLAFDRDRRVLLALTANPSLGANLVQQMAESDDAEFKRLSIQHPKLAPATLELLAQDQDESVRQAARARLGLPEEEPGFFARWFKG